MKSIRLALVLAVLSAIPAVALAQPSVISVSTPPGPGGLICSGGFIYSFVGVDTATGLNRYSLGGTPCGGSPTTTTGAYGHAYYPVTDGPNSVQFTSARVALDLESIDVEGPARFDPGDADTVGGAVTYYDAPGTDGERLEGRYEKNWRPFEGQRTRAIVNLPVNGVVENSGQFAISGLLSGGFEIPVAPNWSLTPRAGIGGASGSAFFGGDGILGTVSLASRYRIAQVARGDLVIGNLISYTGDTAFGNNNVLFRNGIAYQWPLKHMMFGRQVSARVSYVNTYITGDAVGIDDYHEFAINFGVRMREQDVRSRFELLRFGVLYTHAESYDAVTATVGYRF